MNEDRQKVIKACYNNHISLYYKHDPSGAQDDDFTYYLKATIGDGEELWTLSHVSSESLWEQARELLQIEDGWIKLI